MAKGVNIFEIMHAFWAENEYVRFSTSEIALFFFLVNRANSRRWHMPVICSTSQAAQAIGASRSTVVTARERLRQRGLISFTEGKDKTHVSSYVLNLNTSSWTADLKAKMETDLTNFFTDVNADDLTDGLTDGITVGATDDATVDATVGATDDVTDGVTVGATLLNIKNRNIKNKNIISFDNKNLSIHKSVEILEKEFLTDASLHAVIRAAIPDLTDADIRNQIMLFFQRLRKNKETEREEKDCREYLVNSITKYFKTFRHGNKKTTATQSVCRARALPEARNYDTSF